MSSALAQSWPPFVLIAGLLMIGLVANRDGLFAWGGARLEALPGGGLALLGAALLLDAVVTAILNLDTAVVFLTPVLVFAARRRRVGVEPFLYGCVFMANASSLFLPGSNLTNLLVLDAHGGGSGASFAAKMFPIAITAAVVTAIGIAFLFRRSLKGPPAVSSHLSPTVVDKCERMPGDGAAVAGTVAGGTARLPVLVLGPGLLATAAAVVLVLVLRRPALAVLAVG
ncbi:MAG: hypothetical protein J0H06_15595, partial [Actinobacteria bacterium]|nr:hypothetical protein [Actinomycetota bacterium]